MSLSVPPISVLDGDYVWTPKGVKVRRRSTRREFFTVTMGTRTSALLATKAEADGGRRHEGF
jgi:hypothetical protein